MDVGIIVHSRTGVTKKVAEAIKGSVESAEEHVEIRELIPTKRKGFIGAGRAALKGKHLPYEPIDLDVTGFDMLFIGGPIWSGRTSPYLLTLTDEMGDDVQGKKIVLFYTSSGPPKEQGKRMIADMTRILKEHGAEVSSEDLGLKKEVVEKEDISGRIADFLDAVRA